MPRPQAQSSLPLIPQREKPLLMLMDGHAMVHRSWHAISVRQHLSVQKTGEDVTAVFGFATTFLKALQDWSPTHCAIAFDLPAPTFRHLKFAEYKAQRPEAPPELRPQFDRVRQLMRAFGVPIFEVEGFEADDVLGTLCRQATEQGTEALILTGDTDTLQLVSPTVRVALHFRIQERKLYDGEAVAERYGGLTPAQLPHFKALVGDQSDNIPGVRGVGEKTASKLLLQFGTIQGLYERIGEVAPPDLRETLRAHREQVLQGLELTTIVRDVPMGLDMGASRFGRFRRDDVVALCRELEFFSLAGKIPMPTEAPASTAKPLSATAQPSAATDYRAVTTIEGVEALARELKQAGAFAFDTETTSTDAMKADLVGLSFSTGPGHGRYVPVGHDGAGQVPLAEALARLKPVFEDASLRKTAHNANYDMTVLANQGVTVARFEFDTMVAAHLLGRKAIGLKALALDILGHEMTPITALIGTGRNQLSFSQVPLEAAAPYACADADMTGRLRQSFEPELRRLGLWDLFMQVEVSLVPVLVTMQRHGVCVDVDALRAMSRDLGQQLASLEQEIYQAVGHAFNINSPQQLGEVLFGQLQLAKTKRTRTGSYTTDASALEALKGAHPVVEKVLAHRELSKLKSTYVDSLPELVNPRTGRIHTSYNQTGAATGRVSSSEPNLQNIPVRTEVGRQVRKAFVAQGAPEWTLLSADYSQIELRVLAHLSQDEALLAAFHRGEDIHRATASMMFDVPLDKVTPDHRRIAKILNFGVIYGLSAYGIAQQTEFSPDEGQRFIDSYFSKYPGIRAYLDGTKEKARREGFVETALHRRRYVTEISAPNFNVRQAAERMAVNMPVQGTAADIMKLAMIRVQRRLDEAKLRTRMILQVHDELVFELPLEEEARLREIVLAEMPAALQLAVPLKIDLKTGASWGDME